MRYGKDNWHFFKHIVTQIISIPACASQSLPPRIRFAGRFCSHLARLAPLVSKQTIQKQPGRAGYTLLAEQWTYPRLERPQRRHRNLKRGFDR